MGLKLKETVKFEQLDSDNFQLDVRGYGCPHVQIYTEKALKKIESGKNLTVIFDNPSSGESITYLCTSSGDDLFKRDESNGTFTWSIRRA
ncbi:MAG: sulfurtransferase TusA family protein [Cellvibrio sp.]